MTCANVSETIFVFEICKKGKGGSKTFQHVEQKGSDLPSAPKEAVSRTEMRIDHFTDEEIYFLFHVHSAPRGEKGFRLIAIMQERPSPDFISGATAGISSFGHSARLQGSRTE